MTDEETVEVPAWAAREAHQELERAIKHTGGGETGAEAANTPLAEVLRRMASLSGRADLDDFTLGFIEGEITKVAEERNVDISGADPLVDRTFRARNAFETALLDGMDGEERPITFAPRYVSPIRTGEKTKTIRYDVGPVNPGDTLVMRDNELEQEFARAPVKAVWEMSARTLVHPEVTLLEDGHRDYDDVHELLGHLYEFYPEDELGPETPLTIVQWGDVEEVDDE